jgi:hypothetical protein
MRIRVALVALVLLLTGCGITTPGPLSDPLKSEADSNLYGHWIAIMSDPNDDAKSKKVEWHLFIGKHVVEGNPKSIMEFVDVLWSPETQQVGSNGHRGREYFTTTTIGKSSYMSLFEHLRDNSLTEANSYRKWAADPDRSCSILRYRCDGKKLSLWFPCKDSDETVKKLAALGKLELVGKRPTVESLVRYLGDDGGELLFDQLVCEAKKVP